MDRDFAGDWLEILIVKSNKLILPKPIVSHYAMLVKRLLVNTRIPIELTRKQLW